MPTESSVGLTLNMILGGSWLVMGEPGNGIPEKFGVQSYLAYNLESVKIM